MDENYQENLTEGNDILDLENLDQFGRIIDEKINNYWNVSMGDKNDKNIQFCENDLPKGVRILGIHFDPKLYFNEHLNIVLNKAKYELYKLQQLAYCKYYQFSAHAIFKLFESVIQPKLEYGLVTIANETK